MSNGDVMIVRSIPLAQGHQVVGVKLQFRPAKEHTVLKRDDMMDLRYDLRGRVSLRETCLTYRMFREMGIFHVRPVITAWHTKGTRWKLGCSRSRVESVDVLLHVCLLCEVLRSSCQPGWNGRLAYMD